MKEQIAEDAYIEQSTRIVGAYVSNNALSVGDLTRLIGSVHRVLKELVSDKGSAPIEEPKPAVPVKRSVTNDHIICLEDGKAFKSLRRHLKMHHSMSPDQYRERWGLSQDYPMVAPSYSETRSELARAIGLGRKSEKARKVRKRR